MFDIGGFMDWQLKTLVGNRGSFVSTRGCEGWMERWAERWLASSLSVYVGDPQFVVVVRLFLSPTNILSLCVVEKCYVPKPWATAGDSTFHFNLFR